jgi:hypothetical protein
MKDGGKKARRGEALRKINNFLAHFLQIITAERGAKLSQPVGLGIL